MTWNLKELKEDVEFLYGRHQRDLLAPCLASIVDREWYARFHLQEAMILLKEFLANRDDEISLIRLTLGSDELEQKEFYLRRRKAEAHLVACMQSMHALSDTLGHVVYFSLGMNLSAHEVLDARKISIHAVHALLKAETTTQYLKGLVNQLIEPTSYQYLSDLVNHSKHRSIVGTSFTVESDQSSGRLYGLEFIAFSYEGKEGVRNHDSRWADSFIEVEYARQSALANQIGNTLNQLVREKRALTTHAG